MNTDTEDTVMLSVEGVSKIYFTETANGPSGGVHEANFKLRRGTFFTLLGPSGCGKTTTLRCIAGLEEPDRGVIRVGDRTMFDRANGISVSLNHRNIGMVFQSYAIWPHMTVFENVAFPLRVANDRKYRRAEIEQLVEEALATVSLEGFAERPATRLSGGQQQRVALARAIVRKPRLLLLDEPLSNLDASLREEMREELRRLQQQMGITTVYVTHDQSEALEMSDLIAVMEHGRIIQMGSPQEIYHRPRTRFVADFVGTTNLLTAVVAEKSPGYSRLSLPNGRSIACGDIGDIGIGKTVEVAIRPESLTMTTEPARQEGANTLSGKVTYAGFIGNMNRYHVDIDGIELQMYSDNKKIYSVGDNVFVSFDRESSIVYGK